jgi:hypothetical protein
LIFENSAKHVASTNARGATERRCRPMQSVEAQSQTPILRG